jgi:hypothetical protein
MGGRGGTTISSEHMGHITLSPRENPEVVVVSDTSEAEGESRPLSRSLRSCCCCCAAVLLLPRTRLETLDGFCNDDDGRGADICGCLELSLCCVAMS